ncbi:Proline dehydrogenase 1, mitochondrial [Eumeta japonica]|uniref:Proline dehydrogenase n=1 Tax=Eumeta variegata TaxID=151549 RepID=A0A4C1TUJ7_EUMVA|nr:Proline dehydrogenase 1, mitochondrial [Eumeta japonica]
MTSFQTEELRSYLHAGHGILGAANDRCDHCGDSVRDLRLNVLSEARVVWSNLTRLMKRSRQLLGKKLFEILMKATFYGQFVAGEDQHKIRPVLERLRNFGVKSILDYSVEEDLSQEEAEKREVSSRVGCVRSLSPFYLYASADGVEERPLVSRSRSHARLRRNATMSHAFLCVHAFLSRYHVKTGRIEKRQAKRCRRYLKKTAKATAPWFEEDIKPPVSVVVIASSQPALGQMDSRFESSDWVLAISGTIIPVVYSCSGQWLKRVSDAVKFTAVYGFGDRQPRGDGPRQRHSCYVRH